MGRHLLRCSDRSTVSPADSAVRKGSLCSNSPIPGDRLSLTSDLSINHIASLPVTAQGIFPAYFVSCTYLGEQDESLICCLSPSSALVALFSTVESPACSAVPSFSASAMDVQLPGMLALQSVTGIALAG